jgi:GT2 family glycosyltransferase
METGQNLGFGKANNIGLKRVLDNNADYAFLLNQDAWIEKDTIEQLIGIHERHREYGILSPLQSNADGSLIDMKFNQLTIAPMRELISDTLLQRPVRQEIYSTNFANAACWLLPRATILKVGGFDPLFPHCGEDDDYIRRVTWHQMRIGLCPGLKIYHDREYRDKEETDAQSINRYYIRTLAGLKDPFHEPPPVMYLYKRLVQAHLMGLFATNKRRYAHETASLRRLIKTYTVALSHRESEMKGGAPYLTGDLSPGQSPCPAR